MSNTPYHRKIAVIGLGYVGLPAAVAFAQQGTVIGFDINAQRITELKQGFDRNQVIDKQALQNIQLTDNPQDLAAADFYIIAVPTPVDTNKQPLLLPVLKASKIVGNILKTGDIVVYESTVYPGATEEICVPVLEKQSGLGCGSDFHVGYSPERINPGDQAHHFTTITKIVSGQDAQTLDIIAQVYTSVITAGVYRASSIQVAEAAKVIENTQRDVNIALINELAMIFNRIGLDTHEVLAAATTKWNFLSFTPGLVGGHCIGIDPYYLKHKAEQVGYTPQIIPAARNLNDSMGQFIAHQMLIQLGQQGYLVEESIVTILGLAFKENVSDLRNTRVIDIVETLQQRHVTIQVHDPLVNAQAAYYEYGITLVNEQVLQKAQGVILAVPHRYYIQQGWSWLQKRLEKAQGIVLDVKGVLPRDEIPEGIALWRL